MKRLFALVVLIITTSLTACSQNQYIDALKESHSIVLEELDGDMHGCTATAVGPHTLLTATHCKSAADELKVEGDIAEIVEAVSDNLDHTLLFLSGIEFKEWAQINKGQGPDYGESVFIVGNPAEYTHLLRKGYVAGVKDEEIGSHHVMETLLDLNGYFGDSGSAVFNSSGKIVSTISIMHSGGKDGASYKWMGYFPLNFTQDTLDRAVKF